MICFFTYRDKKLKYKNGFEPMVHSSFVDLGKGFYLPEDVFEYSEADYAVKEIVKRLVEIELEKQPGSVLVDICEFDNDDEYEEEDK